MEIGKERVITLGLKLQINHTSVRILELELY